MPYNPAPGERATAPDATALADVLRTVRRHRRPRAVRTRRVEVYAHPADERPVIVKEEEK